MYWIAKFKIHQIKKHGVWLKFNAHQIFPHIRDNMQSSKQPVA